MLDAYLYDGLRSPIGRHAGKLAPVRPDDLAGEVIAEVVKRNGVKPEEISDVILGCVTQAGEDCRNVARFAALMAGLPPTTPAVTVNRLCASGLQAVTDAARAITAGEGELYIAGGVESMSRAPYVFAKSETPYGRDVKLYDTTIGSRFTNPKFRKLYGDHQMPETGDNVAKDFNVTREQADEFALASQKKYAKAEAEGFYKGEILPIALPAKKKDAPPAMVDADEHPRRDSTMESLAKLKPLYEGGVVTAGNASGVNDGAAALVVASRKWGEKNGRKPIAKILSAASAAVEPRIMGVGPAYAIPKALERAGKTLKDMDLIEINEAFASQVLACLRLMNVDFKDARVNPNGGAIAIGHPLGCSGARLALTVARELQQSGRDYAAVSLCIGVGQGLAVILQRT
ncbi:MAG: 3-oxoadipyl-CoA thiolase [Betaproteobacteria bacterium]|nr:3-oxoadipyl-CoA thiolase [Betaproteobacteria bacterium]MDH5221425.1 3-oxoadipyl-CoA thiolase [Betaproteobacteria bacterium]MDH5351764.1 3-oxoadipyl-CoA thiolase [Betaproteobacteria bacterium]